MPVYGFSILILIIILIRAAWGAEKAEARTLTRRMDARLWLQLPNPYRYPYPRSPGAERVEERTLQRP